MDIETKVKEKLSALKKVLFEEEIETPTEENFVDVKAADGTTMRIEPAVEVGATVQVIDESGELMEAADGDIELEDGSVITVEAGVVANLVASEVPAEEGEEMAKEDEPVKDEFDAEKFGETLKADILKSVEEMFEAKLKDLATSKDVEDVTAEFKKISLSTVELIEEVANAPIQEETKKVKEPFKKRSSGQLTAKEVYSQIQKA
jgi:xanthine dehydrogenase molybdopterin-binding subunit B